MAPERAGNSLCGYESAGWRPRYLKLPEIT